MNIMNATFEQKNATSIIHHIHLEDHTQNSNISDCFYIVRTYEISLKANENLLKSHQKMSQNYQDTLPTFILIPFIHSFIH